MKGELTAFLPVLGGADDKMHARRRSPMKRQYGDSPSYRERGESPAKRDGTSSRRERRSSMVLGKEVETEFDGWNPECPG